MASTFSAQVDLDIRAYEFINDGVAQGSIPAEIRESLSLATGTGDEQIDLAYYKRESGIAAGVTTVYDLTGTLTDKSGNAVNFAEVVFIAIRNRSTDAVDHLEVGPDASHGFGVLASNRGFWKDASDRSIVMADSWWSAYNKAGVLVGAGSSDELSVITPSGSAGNTWDILILGRSS